MRRQNHVYVARYHGSGNQIAKRRNLANQLGKDSRSCIRESAFVKRLDDFMLDFETDVEVEQP